MANDYIAQEFGSDGRLVLIEPETVPYDRRRVFRYMPGDALEWCSLADWREHNTRARWYGWHSKDLPATMTAD